MITRAFGPYLYRVAADLVNFVLFDVLHRHQPIISGRTRPDARPLSFNEVTAIMSWPHRTIEQYMTDVATASGLLQ